MKSLLEELDLIRQYMNMKYDAFIKEEVLKARENEDRPTACEYDMDNWY